MFAHFRGNLFGVKRFRPVVQFLNGLDVSSNEAQIDLVRIVEKK
jgi:hypothetical protein